MIAAALCSLALSARLLCLLAERLGGSGREPISSRP